MLEIFVCDDDPVFLESLLPEIEAAFAEISEPINTRGFTSADAFRTAARESNEPCLIFMDLQLDDADGYTLCEELRNIGRDFEVVFITNYPERMPEAFAHRPIGFITKSNEGLSEALKAIPGRYARYHAPTELYTIETRSAHITIPISEIEYFENSVHNVTIRTRAKQYRQRAKLDDIEAIVGNRFVRVHQSYLVNIDMISGIDRNNHRIRLRSEHEIPISKSRYAEVVRRFIDEHL